MASLQEMQRQLNELQAAIQGKMAAQTSDDKIKALEDAQSNIKYGSSEHAGLLATGYGFTVEEAKQIIKERDADPRVWPFEEYQKAKAMLEAFTAKPKEVINTKKPWRVRAHSRTVRQV